MNKALLIFLTITILFITGCQQFSLTEEIRINTEDADDSRVTQLFLELEKGKVIFGETIALSPGGGTPPYSYLIEEIDLFYNGDLGSFAGNTYTAGNSVGKVNVILKDNAEPERVVKELLIFSPPSPHSLSSSKLDATKVEITWGYTKDSNKIEGFIITRTDTVNNSTTFQINNTFQRSYTNQNVDGAETYTYSIQSKADGLVSLPTDTTTINMNP